MKNKVIIMGMVALLVLNSIGVASAVSCINNCPGDEVMPVIYECPPSADGRHHYYQDGTEFVHHKISDTRCITYDGVVYVCSECGNRYVSYSNDITEHEFGSRICVSFGDPT